MVFWKKTTRVDQISQEKSKSQRPPAGNTSAEDKTTSFEEGLQHMLGKDLFQEIKAQAMQENKSVEQVFQEQYDELCDLVELGVLQCQCHPDGRDKYILP